MNSPDSYMIAGVIGILSAAVGALIWIIKFLFQKLLPIMEEVLKMTNRASENIVANTAVTNSADKYLRDRNGRDAEVHKKLIKSVNEIPKEIVKMADRNLEIYKQATQEIKSQHINAQIVEKSIIKEVK